MKKIELYKCEMCGTQYKSEEEALKCEMAHPKKLRIVGERYVASTVDSCGMPVTITLLGIDGKHYTYKR